MYEILNKTKTHLYKYEHFWFYFSFSCLSFVIFITNAYPYQLFKCGMTRTDKEITFSHILKQLQNRLLSQYRHVNFPYTCYRYRLQQMTFNALHSRCEFFIVDFCWMTFVSYLAKKFITIILESDEEELTALEYEFGFISACVDWTVVRKFLCNIFCHLILVLHF